MNDAEYCRAQAAVCKRLAGWTSAEDVTGFLYAKERDWLKMAEALERRRPDLVERSGQRPDMLA